MVMRKHNIAPDGSCLFSAIDYLCTGVSDSSAPTRLRLYCAEVILANQSTYSEVRLGKHPVEYAQWIQIWDSYGGETEIILLCDLYQVEICVASIESLSLLTYKPSTSLKDVNKNRRIYLLYNGQHYNAVVDDSDSEERRIFDLSEEYQSEVLRLAKDEHQKRDIELRTRMRKKIQCSCGAILDDAAAFQVHSVDVEHDEDWSYDCKEVTIEELVSCVTDE